jgi:hypothetical protein
MNQIHTDLRKLLPGTNSPKIEPNPNPAIQAILDQVIAKTLTRDEAIAQINAIIEAQ